jgi:hypothetical protein
MPKSALILTFNLNLYVTLFDSYLNLINATGEGIIKRDQNCWRQTLKIQKAVKLKKNEKWPK